MRVLVLNAGSSSLKSSLYELDEPVPQSPAAPLWEGRVEWEEPFSNVRLRAKRHGYPQLEKQPAIQSERDATGYLLQTLWDGPARVLANPAEVDVVGHRVVHGGAKYSEPTLVTTEVKEEIRRLSAFAPEHNPAEVDGIETAERIFKSQPQVAVFDTAFHQSMPMHTFIYPGPYAWYERGIRRYGFHGISHQYCAARTAEILNKDLESLRIVTCHLGHGCSLAAVQDGRSVDTTMGFTPLEGLMMGSRSGTIDPGIFIHLLRKENYSADRLEEVLNRESGLLGVSGVSDDMRHILAAASKGNSRARLAFDAFIHRLRQYLGAMIASLDGVDALAFTAGIGENSPEVRAEACAGFEFLGLKLDGQKNAASPVDCDIASPDSAVRVVVVAAREDWAIAQACWRLARSA
ncbi:MAG TPA: acetate kinase [Terriglobia bacterium]|nr:acetate kinase [Terriglobia bacterium]